MNITKATMYGHVNQMVDAIRTECTSMKRMTVNISQVRPGDMLASSGQVIRQVFDFVHDPRVDDTDPMDLRIKGDDGITRSSVLVQFTQVTGLSVLTADRKGLSPRRMDCIDIFRPVQPEEA